MARCEANHQLHMESAPLRRGEVEKMRAGSFSSSYQVTGTGRWRARGEHVYLAFTTDVPKKSEITAIAAKDEKSKGDP